MGQWGLRPREFIPEWNENRTQPEANKLAVFYRGYTVDEQAEIRRVKARMGREVADIAGGYKEKFEALQDRIDAAWGDDDTPRDQARLDALQPEVDDLLDAQSDDFKKAKRPFYKLASERILAIEQGPERRADTPDDVWFMLSQAWDLMDEVSNEILMSGDVKTDEGPTSGPPSTGD